MPFMLPSFSQFLPSMDNWTVCGGPIPGSGCEVICDGVYGGGDDLLAWCRSVVLTMALRLVGL